MFEWNEKSSDVRFDLDKAIKATADVHKRSESVDVDSSDCVAVADGSKVLLQYGGEDRFALTSHAFDQFARLGKAPSDYLTRLPSKLAADCLNEGLRKRDTNGIQLLVTAPRDKGLPRVRAITSQRYSRIWDAEVLLRAGEMIDRGWTPKRVSYNDSGIELRMRGPVEEFEQSGLSGLTIGARITNSEVGGISLGIEEYVERLVCANGLMVKLFHGKSKTRHIGDIKSKFNEQFGRLSGSDAAKGLHRFNQVLDAARAIRLGDDQDQVIDNLYARRIPELTKTRLADAYDIAESSREDDDPRTLYGMIQGITRLSQMSWTKADRNRDTSHASGRWQERYALDNAAAKLLKGVSLN